MNESLPENFEDVPVWLRSLHGAVLFVLLTSCVAGNSFLLVLVLSHKNLQYRSVLSSLGLVFADLLIAVTWSTQSIANIIAGTCPFGEVGCSILGALTNVGIYARWCIIALITLERFCKILSPFCYARCSKPLLITLSILSWCIPIATIFPWLAGVGVFRFRLDYSVCIITCNSDAACYQFYIVLYGFFFTIGGILPMVLYFMLCIIGHRKAYKMKHITLGTYKASPPVEERAEISTDSMHDNQDLDSTESPENNTRRRGLDSTSSNSSWGGALEKKILITFFMIFVNVFVTQLPIYITSALRSSEEIYTKIPLVVHFIFVHIYLLGSVLDPLLIMRNKDFRDVIMRRWRRRQAQRSQQSSVTNTLLEFAKMSSMLEVQPMGRNNTRRNSCPSTNHMVFVQSKLIKAASLDGGCTSIDEEVSVRRSAQVRIEEEKEEQIVTGEESNREGEKSNVSSKDDMAHRSIGLEYSVTSLWPRTHS